MNKRNLFFVILGIMFLSITAYSSTIPEDFLGTYKFSGSKIEKNEFNKSVDQLISNIPFLMRAFVASKIKKGFRIPQKIVFSSKKTGQISIESDMKSIVSSDLSKTPVKFKNPRGKESELIRELVGSKIYEKVTGKTRKHGTRINSYKLSKDGKKLEYTVKLKGKMLKNPLSYKLSFIKIY